MAIQYTEVKILSNYRNLEKKKERILSYPQVISKLHAYIVKCRGALTLLPRLRVVPNFSSGIVGRAKLERNARACRLFSRGVIFTRARVSLALLSLRKNGGLLVVYLLPCITDNFFFS